MEINVSKSATASCISDGDRRRTDLGDSFQFRGEAIPQVTIAESMRFLGALIASRRTGKLKSAKFELKEMKILLRKTMSRSLLTVQKINAVKIILLPLTGFLLLNGEVGRS
jgi:hypothetical protein